MKDKTGSERKSERLRRKQHARELSAPGVSDPEEQPILVTAPGEENESPRSEHTPQTSEYGSEPDEEGPEPEVGEEDVMTRLRYKRFKGDGSQDADEWLCEFESTALANQENEAAQRRIFQGLLKGEALKWYQDVPDPVRNNWVQLRTDFLQAFREVGGEARALGRLSTLTMKSNESVRRYGQKVKALMQKLTTEIAPNLQVEWYVAGLPESMGFLIRQTRPRTLREAMDAATNYENSAQSLRKSLKRSERQERKRSKKGHRKSRHRRKTSDSESSSESSGTEVSDSSSSSSEEERSVSPPRRLSKRRPREKTIVKVKTEDSDSRKVMKSIQESLEAIKVNLAENRKPRQIVPTSRSNVWCGRCGEPGHYPSECQKSNPKHVHYVYPEEEIYYTMAGEDEEEVYQVQPAYGRGKGIAVPIRSTTLNRNYLPGSSQGMMMQQPIRAPGYPERQVVVCYGCGEPGHYANSCPNRGLGQGAPRVLPCQNCQEYGHQEEQCPKPVQPRPVYKQVQILPREQTALNYGHSAGTENTEK